MSLFPLIIGGLLVVYVGAAIAGGTTRRFAWKSRAEAVVSVVNAAVMVVAARELIPWGPFVPAWLLVAAAMGAAVAVAVLRIPELPTTRPGGRPSREWISVAVQLLVVIAIVAAIAL